MPTLVTGDILTASFLNAITRMNLAQEDLAPAPIPIMGWRYANGNTVDATGGAGNPQIVAGGYGSGTLLLRGQDAHGTTKTETVQLEAVLPDSYVAGETVTLTLTARFSDSGTGTMSAKSIDVEAYEIAEAGTVGADICATAAQTLTTSMAQYSFTLTPTNLIAGDRINIFSRIVLTESGGSGAQKAEFGGATLKRDIKG